jgi:BirA family biotin operon repressor/biotin-[acetyl-CoA-carboxylase] ligase
VAVAAARLAVRQAAIPVTINKGGFMVLPPEFIKNNLSTRIIGREILYFPSVTSTNDIAKEKARQHITEGTVVIADRQTAGKGRLNRTWTSPEGVLAYSVILYPSISQLPCLIMIASLSVVRAIKIITGIQAQIKWPNDILINGKKACGILIENSVCGHKVDYAVVGIGVNANVNLEIYSEITATATSLLRESGHSIELIPLIKQLLIELDKLYLSIADNKSVFEEWRDNLITLGKKVRATSGDRVYEGIAESVESDGSLILRQSDGTRTQISQGDVTLRQ